ncbi:hypothetical protein M407DRAFT_242524 [Tulasnella calospora MUT 4182]|uniref:Uncharacterized protein n=1 Tax=Tulasnella calospora MUT 4182 TaxID=1051891 RepID=A0A0C3QQ75_9AGAM|nr:hypothetical protein M407DRAFT_242524 [Tulasnella calospora MUT 4182]
MRAVFSLFSLVALATTGVFATPVPECLSELCGSIPLFDSSPSPVDFAASITKVETPTRSLPERDVEQLTNAERFVRGLPPKRPKLLQGSSLRRTQPSPVPLTTYRGMVRIDKEDGTGTLGYLSAHPFSGAQYRYQPDINDAAIVTFKFDPAQTLGSASEFMTENSDIQASFPNLGLVQGRDDTDSNIAAGSFHYLYIAGTTPTSPDATPQAVPNSYTAVTGTARTAESEVWTFNSDTNALTLQWVNTDGSKPTTILFTQSTALYASADPHAFNARYPASIIRVTYTFVPL